MLALEIDNPEIEAIFKTRFNGDKTAFIAFINKSLQRMDNAENGEFQFKKLNPKKHAHRLKAEKDNASLSNPFENIEDVQSFSKSLRQQSSNR